MYFCSSEYTASIPDSSISDTPESLPLERTLAGMDVASKNMTVPSFTSPTFAISPGQTIISSMRTAPPNDSPLFMYSDQQGTTPTTFNTGPQAADLGVSDGQRLTDFSHSTELLQPSTSSGNNNAARDWHLGLFTLADVATAAIEPVVGSMARSPPDSSSETPLSSNQDNVEHRADHRGKALEQLSTAIAAGLKYRPADESLKTGILRVLGAVTSMREDGAQTTVENSCSGRYPPAMQRSLGEPLPSQCPKDLIGTTCHAEIGNKPEATITLSEVRESLMVLVKSMRKQRGKKLECQSKGMQPGQGQMCPDPTCRKVLPRQCDMK